MIDALSAMEHVRIWRQLPAGPGQQIPHMALHFDQAAMRTTHEALLQRLLTGRPRVAVQLVTSQGGVSTDAPQEIRVHPHTLREGEEVVVAQRLREELAVAARPTS